MYNPRGDRTWERNKWQADDAVGGKTAAVFSLSQMQGPPSYEDSIRDAGAVVMTSLVQLTSYVTRRCTEKKK